MNDRSYFYGIGRRKCAVARVRLFAGGGAIVVNGQPFEEVFPQEGLRKQVVAPLVATNNLEKFSASVKVAGGGNSGQAGAIRHGIARALVAADENLKPILRSCGFLTRDPRVKERKKYGLIRARKAKQYTKR